MRSALFLALLALALRARAGESNRKWVFGNGLSIGPASGDAYITKATWSVVPPRVPHGGKIEDPKNPPWMSIWIGIQTVRSSPFLFQPIVVWSPDQKSRPCAGSETEWCVSTGVYTSGDPEMLMEPWKEGVPNKAQLDFQIDVKDLGIKDSYDVSQKVWTNGRLLSQLPLSYDGWKTPASLYSGNECFLGTCGTLDAYTWDNVTVVLSTADKSFGDTLVLRGANGSFTSDDGKTWHADSININKDYFKPSQRMTCSPKSMGRPEGSICIKDGGP